MTRNKILTLCIFLPTFVQADVIINGLEAKVKDNTLLLLSLNEQTCTTPNWKIKRLFAESNKEIDQSLRALGYYHSSLSKKLYFDKDCWHAEFDVQAGTQVVIHSIDITIEGEAKNDTEFLALQKKLHSNIDNPLQHNLYENFKTRLTALAQERGYLKAKWKEKKLRIDKDTNQATIKLVFDSGLRQRFGHVLLEQDVLEPELANKYSHIERDSFYSSKKLVETYDALSKSGYFKQVEIHPDFENIEALHVPITIHLTPKEKHHFSVGLGYGTDVGLLFNGLYENRRLNPEGDFFTANLDVSLVLSTLETEYSMPLENPLNDFYTLGAGIKRENTDSFTSKSATISNRLKYGLWDKWKQTLFADFSYELFNIEAQPEKQSLLLILGGNWTHTISNNKLRPTEGRRLRFDLSGSYETPLSNVSFLRANIDSAWVKPLPWAGFFTARASLGAMAVNKFDNLPTSYRFYAGGINSVRGYDYKELAPKNALGQVKGGQMQGVLSAEYEHTIFDDWGVAAFIDSGNAFNIDDISIKTGAGLGVRWYSPIGPVRIDFALPMNDAKSGYQIYFAAGARL